MKGIEKQDEERQIDGKVASRYGNVFSEGFEPGNSKMSAAQSFHPNLTLPSPWPRGCQAAAQWWYGALNCCICCEKEALLHSDLG